MIKILDLTTNIGRIGNKEHDKQYHSKREQQNLECGKPLRTNNISYYNQIIAREKKWEGMEPIDQKDLKDGLIKCKV